VTELFRQELTPGISGFRRDIDEMRAVLGYCAAPSGNPSWTSLPLKVGPIGCPETSVKDYHSTLHNIPEEGRSYAWKFLMCRCKVALTHSMKVYGGVEIKTHSCLTCVLSGAEWSP
jgi:hypothetical protein